ncbi:MAG: YncE family protein [Muribaculaceae bacterium]|nr:YncE family protein [Muribaculaceae bacterium]
MLKMRKISFFKTLILATAAAGLTACSNDEPDNNGGNNSNGNPTGVFVLNEGGYMQSNGSLSFYNTESGKCENDLFRNANGFGPGDVVQSMTLDPASPNAWLVVNNSQVIFAIDPDTYKEKGRITEGITSPRQMAFIDENKAYVTQFYTNAIAVVNPKTYAVTKYIEYPVEENASPSTGEMVAVDGFMYVCCPNYNSALLKVDTSTDKVVDVIYPGIQPSHIVADANKDLWVICDGGYQGSPYGFDATKLVRISTSDFKVKAEYNMGLGDYVPVLTIDRAGRNLFWINGGVYKMDIAAGGLPSAPIITPDNAVFYGMTVSPGTGEILVTDAVDFSQNGRLLRYAATGGDPISAVTVGVCPHAFCWK